MWSMAVLLVIAQKPVDPFAKWEKAIVAFEKQDAEKPPAKGGILFAGSSSIVRWKLPEYFPKLDAINRGFGGSQVRDTTHFVDRVVTKHDPRIVVFYAGDNDIHAGRSADEVADDFKALTQAIWEKCPKTRIIYVSIKPSVSRWKEYETQKKANAKIETYCRSNDRLKYFDIVTPMLGEDGKPKPELFANDGLHLSEKGYRIWTDRLSPLLK